MAGAQELRQVEYHPLTPERWSDFEQLFGPRGACAGCWCMFWRLKRADFERQVGEANRQAMRALVQAGPPPGLLAYVQGQPAGWVCIGPRHHFPALERSRLLARLDETPVWSVVCFFVDKRFRRRGLSLGLLRAAVAHAISQGASLIEGYPLESGQARLAAASAYTGLSSTFLQAGFVECARRSPRRPIMRYTHAAHG